MNLKNQDYKCSYQGFVFWMILFILSYVVLMFLPLEVKYITYLTLFITASNIVLLTYMIYKNEYIYWYSGITYEQATQASSKQRKEYAYKHLILFFKAALLYSLITLLMIVLDIPYLINVLVLVFVLIYTSIKSINIKI